MEEDEVKLGQLKITKLGLGRKKVINSNKTVEDTFSMDTTSQANALFERLCILAENIKRLAHTKHESARCQCMSHDTDVVIYRRDANTGKWQSADERLVAFTLAHNKPNWVTIVASSVQICRCARSHVLYAKSVQSDINHMNVG